MKINRNNYELYFMDYLDGNLTDRDILMLEDFLLLNPDLRAELEGTEKIILTPERLIYNQKDLLIKPDLSLPVNSDNFEDFCIAANEGDLTEEQLSGLNKFKTETPGSEKLFSLYSHLRLLQDDTIVFPGKEKLKKSKLYLPKTIIYPVLSVAAALAFLLVIYISNELNTGVTKNITSVLNTPAIPDSPAEKDRNTSENQVSEKKNITVQQASVLNMAYPKAKKKTQTVKVKEAIEKNKNENKSKLVLPAQRLNPSIQIKLPSIAENQDNPETIDAAKIKFNEVMISENSPDYLSLTEYARQQLAEKLLGNKFPVNSRPSAWEIADAGINGINRITGGEMKLEKRTDNQGDVTAYSFNSRLLSFSTTR